MPDRLRLLAIIEASSITGPAKNLLDFAKRSQADVETTIVTFTRGQSSNVFTDAVRQSGIPLELVDEQGPFDRSVIAGLQRIVQARKPQIVQTHAVKSHFLARCAGLPSHAPWIAFHHGYTWPSLRARVYNQLDRWSLRTPQKVVTVSLPFQNELIARGVQRNRIEILHNAIRPDWGQCDPAQAAATREQWKIPREHKVILIVGRLSREKDHITLLRAVHQLASPDLHVVLVGEGPERGAIEAEIQTLRMGDRVTLTGQQKSAEPFYGIADIAVLSSLSEGSPNALLEAMAAGVPAVATKVGGIPEIVTHGESALLVEPSDAAAMSTALRSLLESPDLARQLVQRSHHLIEQNHTPEGRVRKLLGIYRDVLE